MDLTVLLWFLNVHLEIVIKSTFFLDCEVEFTMYFNAYKPIRVLWSFPLRILVTWFM